MILRGLILLLALAGLLDALYFTLAYYGRAKKARWVPAALCAPESSSCARVVRTPHARLLGVPNSVLGIAYYLGLVGWILAGGSGSPAIATAAWLRGTAWLLIAVGAGAVLLGSYLIHALWRVLHIHCPLCYAAHAINAALLVLLILVLR